LQHAHKKFYNLDPANPANMSAIRKKYRKMRIKFDEKMRQSNERYMEEQLAMETARRLAQENELARPQVLFEY